MSGEINPVSLEQRLGEMVGQMRLTSQHLESIDRHLEQQNSRIKKAEHRLDTLEDRNMYQDGYSAGRGELSWRDAIKIAALMVPLMGVAVTVMELVS